MKIEILNRAMNKLKTYMERGDIERPIYALDELNLSPEQERSVFEKDLEYATVETLMQHLYHTWGRKFSVRDVYVNHGPEIFRMVQANDLKHIELMQNYALELRNNKKLGIKIGKNWKIDAIEPNSEKIIEKMKLDIHPGVESLKCLSGLDTEPLQGKWHKIAMDERYRK